MVAKANLWGGDIRETLSLVRDRGESIERKQAGLSTDGVQNLPSFRLGFVFIIAGRTEVKWIIKERSLGL